MSDAAVTRLLSARALIECGRFGEAEVALRALLGDHPSYLQVNHELAIACFHTGAVAEAVERFAAVAEVNPEGLRSPEFYDAILALPDHARGLAILERLLPRYPGATKMIEGFGRLIHRRAAAAGTPHGDIDVVGDSHAVTGFAAIARCRVHFLASRTLHHMALQAVDLAALGIAPGAKLVTVFGEIDCRCHVVKIARRTGEPARARLRPASSTRWRT